MLAVHRKTALSLRISTLYNLLGSITPAAVALLTIPLLLQRVGEVRFGCLALVWLLLGHLVVFDFGVSRATANRIAKLAPNDLEVRRQVFWTAVWMNLGFGLLGACGVLLVAEPLATRIPDISGELRREFLDSIPWLAAAVPSLVVGGTLTGALEGKQQFAVVNVLQASGAVLVQVAPIVAAYAVAVDLDVLVAAVVLARTLSALLLLAANLLVVAPGAPCAPQPRHAFELFGYGAWIFLSALLVPFFMTLDKLLIGAMLGAAAVAYYSIPDQLVRRISVLPAAFARSVFPRISALDAVGARELSLRSMRILFAVVTPVVVMLSVVMHPFLSVWIDHEFADRASGPGVLLAAGIWLNSIAMIPYAHLQGSGRPDVTAKCHLVEILPHVLMLWVGVRLFGVTGAAAAMLAVTALDTALLMACARMQLWRKFYFWQGATWIAAACVLGVDSYDAGRWHYLAAFAVVGGAIAWALRVSPELGCLAATMLQRVPALYREWSR